MKIPIKKYVMDESLSWEERYAQLDAHHCEETKWLIAEAKRHFGKWRSLERDYVLPCFKWAEHEGIDLRQMVLDNPGKNCVELFVNVLKREIERLEKEVVRAWGEDGVIKIANERNQAFRRAEEAEAVMFKTISDAAIGKLKGRVWVVRYLPYVQRIDDYPEQQILGVFTSYAGACGCVRRAIDLDESDWSYDSYRGIWEQRGTDAHMAMITEPTHLDLSPILTSETHFRKLEAEPDRPLSPLMNLIASTVAKDMNEMMDALPDPPPPVSPLEMPDE